MKNKQVLIITGGYLSAEFADAYLKNRTFSTVIAVDKGMSYALELNLKVDYVVGDFDSVSKEVLDTYESKAKLDGSIIIKRYNTEKDETDTEIALEYAIKEDPEEIILLGATGIRIDHLMANIQLLSRALEHNIKAYIVDEYNKIYLVNQNITLYKEKLFGSYVSLIPLTEVVRAVTLEGFKYPLLKRDMYIGGSLGVSNEVTETQAHIIFESGTLIVTESKD